MSPLGYTIPGHSLVLRPPKRVDKISAKIEKLQKEIKAQRRALNKANNELKILHLSEKKWGWIGTTFGVLAFATPFIKEIADIVDLNTNDSGCQNSQASAAVGSTAAALAIAYIIVKTINNCIVKKREVLISPLEKQLEELKALEKIFEIMETFANEEEESKEALLIQCTQQLKKHHGNSISDKYKQQWFYLLAQQLPEGNEIKQLVTDGKRIAKEVSSEQPTRSSENDEVLVNVEAELSSSSGTLNPKETGEFDTDSKSDRLTTSSPFLTDEDADNQAPPLSPKASRIQHSLGWEGNKSRLEEITNRLNEKFGYKQFQEGKVVFSSGI